MILIFGCSSPPGPPPIAPNTAARTARLRIWAAALPPLPLARLAPRRQYHIPMVHQNVYTGLFCADGRRFPDECDGWRVAMQNVPCASPHIAKFEYEGTLNGLPVGPGCYTPWPGASRGSWNGKTDDTDDAGPRPVRVRCNAKHVANYSVVIRQRPPWGIINGVKVKAGCYELQGVR